MNADAFSNPICIRASDWQETEFTTCIDEVRAHTFPPREGEREKPILLIRPRDFSAWIRLNDTSLKNCINAWGANTTAWVYQPININAVDVEYKKRMVRSLIVTPIVTTPPQAPNPDLDANRKTPENEVARQPGLPF